LAPKHSMLYKLVVYVPKENQEQLANAMYEAGAGQIGNYKECSFSLEGSGTFTPVLGANPTIGQLNSREIVEEVRFEVLVDQHRLNRVLVEMKKNHPYEEVAHDIIPLANENQFEGAGMIGKLSEPVETKIFLTQLKSVFNCGIIRHTKLVKDTIQTVAICGGSGSFLLNDAKRQKADIFITGDFKYHEFFDAEDQLIIADIGHFESEQYT